MPKQRIAIYPGTFDPVTNGHMDIIVRASNIVDRLIVGVAINAGKGPLFQLEERVTLLHAELKALGSKFRDRIEVRPFETLLIKFAEEMGASIIVRGLRAVSDFEYEFQMGGMNRRMDPEVETVFLMASETNQFISSRFVKEIARLGGDISPFVSQRVARSVHDLFAGKTPPHNQADEEAHTIPRPAVRTPI
ncbi:MAG: pantetheine-phosphate adenylyltransferase [Proteobacteria bacterium]|nr:pantetheine-phosphate adenylyltransferase [Pseudomonadota bacterium]